MRALAGSFQCDVSSSSDWVHFFRSIACAGELLLCFTANVASCKLWLRPGAGRGEYLEIVVGFFSALLMLESFALSRIPIHLLRLVGSA